MTDRRLAHAFRAWIRIRHARFPGFLATICLSAAAVLMLSQAVERPIRPLGRIRIGGGAGPSSDRAARRAEDARWRDDVTRKLEEILAHLPVGPATAAGP